MSSGVQSLKTFAASSGFKRYFANTSWLMAEKVLRMVVGLFVGVWVARYLGPERFGLLSYAMSVVAIFVSVSHMGLEGVVVRDIVRNENIHSKILGSAFVLRILATLVMVSAICIFLFFTTTTAETKLLIGIITFGVFWDAFLVFDFYNQSQVKIKYNSISYTIAMVFASLFKVYLIIKNAPLVWFAIVIVFEKVLLSFFFLISYRFQGEKFFKLSFDVGIIRSLLKNAIPLAISGVAIQSFMRVDQVMIKKMVDCSAVGNYAAAVKLCEVWYIIPTVIATAMFPMIIKCKLSNFDIYEKRLQSLYDLVTIVSVFIALIAALLSSKIIYLLFGEQYQESGRILAVYIWASVFVFSGIISGRWYLVENLQVIALVNTIIGLVFNVSMNLYLIPKQGAMGAAISTVVSQALAMIMLNSIHKKTRVNFYMQIRALNIIAASKRLVGEIYA